MNHETLKWKTFLFSLTGWAKQLYKLHVSGCHGSWVVLKDQFCFAFFPLSKIIDLQNEIFNFAQKEGESLGAAWSRYNHLALSGLELYIPDAMFMYHFVHELGTEFAEYLDMTSGGVFVHCTIWKWNAFINFLKLSWAEPASPLSFFLFLFPSLFFPGLEAHCSRPDWPIPGQLLGRKSLAPLLAARRQPPCRLSAMPGETTLTLWPKSSSQTRLPPGVLSEAVEGRCSPNHNERETLFWIQTEANPVQIWRCSR
jgi:hypothetical protein